MTMKVHMVAEKMSPPTDGELLDNREDNDGDIDRWENDGGMSSSTKKDRSRH